MLARIFSFFLHPPPSIAKIPTAAFEGRRSEMELLPHCGIPLAAATPTSKKRLVHKQTRGACSTTHCFFSSSSAAPGHGLLHDALPPHPQDGQEVRRLAGPIGGERRREAALPDWTGL